MDRTQLVPTPSQPAAVHPGIALHALHLSCGGSGYGAGGGGGGGGTGCGGGGGCGGLGGGGPIGSVFVPGFWYHTACPTISLFTTDAG